MLKMWYTLVLCISSTAAYNRKDLGIHKAGDLISHSKYKPQVYTKGPTWSPTWTPSPTGSPTWTPSPTGSPTWTPSPTGAPGGSGGAGHSCNDPDRQYVVGGKLPFSNAVRHGQTIYTAGMVGWSKEDGGLKEGFEGQFRQAMMNLEKALKDAGASGFEDVVKVTVFLQDMDEYDRLNALYKEYFKKPYPARTAIQVVKLPVGALFEMEMVAVIQQCKS